MDESARLYRFLWQQKLNYQFIIKNQEGRDLEFIPKIEIQIRKQENIMMDLNTEGKGELIKYIVSTNKVSMPKKMVITCSREDAEKIAKQLGGVVMYEVKNG